MLKLWVTLKTFLAKHNNYIHSYLLEKDFMRGKIEQQIDELLLKYEPDNIGGLPFDYAYDSITIFLRDYIDCGMNRAWQMFYHIKGYNAFLVHYTHKPLNKENFKKALENQKITKNIWFYKILNILGLMMAHITVVLENDHKWYSADYGTLEGANDLNDAVQQIASKYNCIPKEIVVQNIYWKILNIKDFK